MTMATERNPIKTDPVRRSQCGNKRRFPKKSSAETAAKLIRQGVGERMHAYPCRFCDGWHIGH